MTREIVFKIIAVIQILGGVAGYLVLFFNVGFVFSLPLILIASFFSLSIFAGFELLKLSKKGFLLSYINLGFQVLKLSGPAFFYEYFSGIKITIGWFSGNIVDFLLGASWFISFLNHELSFGIGVNIVPVIFIIYLKRNQSFIFKNKSDNEVGTV